MIGGLSFWMFLSWESRGCGVRTLAIQSNHSAPRTFSSSAPRSRFLPPTSPFLPPTSPELFVGSTGIAAGPESRLFVRSRGIAVRPESRIVWPESRIVWPEYRIVWPEYRIVWPEYRIVWPEYRLRAKKAGQPKSPRPHKMPPRRKAINLRGGRPRSCRSCLLQNSKHF